ncbi:MAG: hypothetical protein V1862_01125 [Methanobacteriota archaeon]
MSLSRLPLFSLMLICLIAGALYPVAASSDDKDARMLYTTEFSDATGWITNSKDRFYLENETGRYHYLIEGGTASYGAFALPEVVNGPFILEFDVTPVRTDESGTFRFGIGKVTKDSQKGPLIMAELANKKDGRLFYLKTISKENALNLVGSSPSTGSSGSTVRYSDNTTYHIRLTYYATDNRASITVQEVGVPGTIFTSLAPVSGKMEDLSHLFLTSLGDGTPGPQAEGYIDNITLTLPRTQAAMSPSATPTDEQVSVSAVPTLVESILNETSAPTIEPLPEETEIPLPPPPTPTATPKSGGLPLLLLPALAGVAWMVTRRG